MKKHIILATLGSSMLFAGGIAHAENNETKYKKMYSTTQKPELYGTKKAVLHEGDDVRLTDAKYRVLARDFEDGDLTQKMKVVSIDGDKNYQSKIEAKTGKLKNLTVGEHTVKYEVTDKHGNKDDFTTTFEIKKESDKSRHTKDIIQRTVYTAPNTDHIKKAAISRGDNFDRQALGIQLDPGEKIDVKIISSPKGDDDQLRMEVLTDNRYKDVFYQINKKGFTEVAARTDEEIYKANNGKDGNQNNDNSSDDDHIEEDEGLETRDNSEKVSEFRGDIDGTGVPFVHTPRNSVADGSKENEYVIEYEASHKVRDLPYFHEGDDAQQFFEKWAKENEKSKRQSYKINQMTGEKEESGEKPKGFALMENGVMAIFPPSISYSAISRKLNPNDSNHKPEFNIKTLNDLFDRYNKLLDQYDAGIGLEMNPENPLHQRVRSKYFGRSDSNGGGAAYYGGSWTAKNASDLDSYFVDMGWGTLHEVGHGYQGNNRHAPGVGLGEVTNNLLAYFAQHNEDIVSDLNNRYWLDVDRDADTRLANRNKTLPKEYNQEKETFVHDDLKDSLNTLVSLLEVIHPDEPLNTWAQINRKIRENSSKNMTETLPDLFFNLGIKERNIDVTPFIKEWGFSKVTDSKDHIVKQRNADQVVMLADVVTNPDDLKKAMDTLKCRKTAPVTTSQLAQLNIQGKAKLELKGISLDEIKGQNLLVMSKGKVVKKVPITSLNMEIDLPVGAYTVKVPMPRGDKGYKFKKDKTFYLFSTDQYKSNDDKVKKYQYVTPIDIEVIGANEKVISNDSFVVLGDNNHQKLDDAFNLTIFPRADRPTVEYKINLDDKVKAKEETTIEVYTQILAGTNFFPSRPDVTFKAKKGEAFKVEGKNNLHAISNNDIIAVKTNKENLNNIRTYSELGNEYTLNRPKEGTSYYYVSNLGFREVHVSQEDYNLSLAEQEQLKTYNALKEKVKKIPESAYENKWNDEAIKQEIFYLYYKLDANRREEFTELINRLKEGAKPQLYTRAALANGQLKPNDKVTLTIEEGKEHKIDWKEQFLALDAEDAYIELNDDNSKITASKKRMTKPNQYQINVSVKDSDDNTTVTPVDVKVIPPKDFADNEVKVAKEKVQTFDFLTEEERAKVDKAIDDAYVANDIREIVTEAQKENKDRLEKAQRDSKDYVHNIDDLNSEENQAIDSTIDKAKSKASLTQIVKKVKEAVTDRVTKAYDRAKDFIKTERELSQEQDKKALEALNKIDTVAEANAIHDKVKQESDQLLVQRKAQAKAIVEKMTAISAGQKQKVYEAIQNVHHSDELTRIINETQSYDNIEGAKDLAGAQSRAKALVNASDAFSDSEKETITQAIDKAETKEQVAKLSKQVTDEHLTRIAKAKQETKEKLAHADLTAQEKAQFEKQLEEAKTLAAVTAAGKYAKERHQHNLEQVAALAKDFVSTLDNLNENEKQTLTQQLTKATDYDDIHQALETAVKESNHRLSEEKTKVKETITSFKHLKEKEKWLALVDHVRTVNEAKELLELAKKADEWYKNDVTEAKAQAQAIISDFKYMKNEQKEKYKKDIEEASNLEKLESVMTSAVQEEQKLWQAALKEAQTKAKKDLGTLTSLTSEQKGLVTEAIAQAQSEDDVKVIMDKAKKYHNEMVAYEFKVYKETVKENIDQLDELTFVERRNFKEKVDAAKTKRDVQNIFAKAQQKNTDNAVNKAIDIATKTIASLTGLTTQQRQSYTRQVKEADSINEVNTIVAKAKAQEKENKQKPKFNKKENYIHFKKDSYTLWKDLNFKAKKGKSKDYMNQTLKMKGYYVVNGSKYASIYNYQDQWLGYINMDNVVVDNHAGGAYVKYERYVTVTKDNYTLWKDFDFDVKKGTTKSMKGHTYMVKGYYRHFNGSVYYSLYNGKNQWLGYINKNGVTLGGAEGTLRVGMHQGVKKYKQVVKKDYFFWKSFDFKEKKGSTTAWYKKNLYVSGQYEHINGSVYYSVYDKQGGRWLGYVNKDALK